MPALWSRLLALSLANRILLAFGAAVGVLWLWTAVAARWRNRARTVYVVSHDGRVANGTALAPDGNASDAIAPHQPAPIEDAADPQPAERAVDEPPPVEAERDADAPGDLGRAPAWSEDWDQGRRCCPCCDYPTDYSEAHACSLCDWQVPPGPPLVPWYGQVPRVDIAAEVNLVDALGDARACYCATGSALRPEERAEFNGTLTLRALDLRKQIRERLDYLRTADRPDASETWDLIDHLFDDLREALS